jgi:hypothetical protein
VAIMLVDLNDAFSDKIGFKESHIDDILDILPIRFPFFRLNDIYQVCFGLKTSKYGVFGRLDVPTFLEACKKYEVEKQEHQHEFLMNLHMRKKDVYNGTKDIKNDFKEKQNEAMSKYLVDKFKTKG